MNEAKTYSFAGKRVEIHALHDAVHTLCRDYRTEDEAEFALSITPADIAFEREKAAREARTEGRAVGRYSDAYLETLAVYRKLAEKLPDYDTVLFHGSCVAVDGAAYLFTAPSGTGKSTHVRLWRELLGARAAMVNDDKPLLRIGETETLVFGTPWDGKHRLSSNIAVPLRALCILERAEQNHIEAIPAAEAYPMLLQQVYRPADPAMLARTLTLLDRLAASVPLYRLGCNREPAAAELAYHTMRGMRT